MKKDSLSYRFLIKVPSFLVSDPYEAFFSFALIISGLADILYPKVVGVVGHTLPTWQVYIWGILLILGSTLTLAGLIGASKSTKLPVFRNFREIERTGQLTLAIATTIWSLVIFSLGPASAASGIFTLSFSVMFLVKAAAIRGLEEYIFKKNLPMTKGSPND